MTVMEARSIIRAYKAGHTIETIQYLTGQSIENINKVIEEVKSHE